MSSFQILESKVDDHDLLLTSVKSSIDHLDRVATRLETNVDNRLLQLEKSMALLLSFIKAEQAAKDDLEQTITGDSEYRPSNKNNSRNETEKETDTETESEDENNGQDEESDEGDEGDEEEQEKDES